MKIEEFKAGIKKKNNSGTNYKYESFSPSLINHSWTWDNPEITKLLERATHLIGELNAFSHIIPISVIDLFIEMHIIKEANSSSRIEGTRTNMEEIILESEDIDPEKRDDQKEVKNYIKAMHSSIDKLGKIPLSTRLLREAHKILMQGVRGDRKNPGEFRRSQNWIGGANLQTAVFIPPASNEVDELMSDLEKFWHNHNINVPQLIKAAISHYQFETIHPFLDGNGRIGRLLIILFLIDTELLSKPSLYLSDYFERNRIAYYDALTMVRTSNDLVRWVKFFLNGIVETAEKGKITFKKILELKDEVDGKILVMGRKAENATKLMRLLYRKPIINYADVMDELKVSPPTANALLDNLRSINILKEATGYKRNRLFVFDDYLKLFTNNY